MSAAAHLHETADKIVEGMRAILDLIIEHDLNEGSSADTLRSQEGKDLWLKIIGRAKSESWYRDRVWPEIDKAYRAGTLDIPALRQFLSRQQGNEPTSPSSPAPALLTPPPPPPVGFKAYSEDLDDWTKWRINVDEYPYDPKGIYVKLNSEVFNGTLPDIPVYWGDADGGIASTNARISCSVDAINNKLIKTNEACTLASNPNIEMIIEDFSAKVHQPHWHAQLISTILHEACHAYMYTHGKVAEGHGPSFRSLLFTMTKKLNMDYTQALGSWQEDFKENMMHMRGVIDIIEQLSTACNVSGGDEWCPVHGMEECWQATPVTEADGIARSSDDPLSHLRNTDGTITIKSHGYPTGPDIVAKIDAYRKSMDTAAVS